MSAADPQNIVPNHFTAAEPQRSDPPPLAFPAPAPALVAAPQPAAPVQAAPSQAAPAHAGFETDIPCPAAQFAPPPLTGALLGRLAELLARADAPTPFAIGLLGPAGSGKTSALRWLAEKLNRQNGALLVTAQAESLAADPERNLAAAIFQALSPVNGALAHEAAQESAHAGADAGAFARAANERLDALRRRLAAERQGLAQTQARRAKLPEALLYESPGSRIDVYAKRLRASFEPRLSRFGFTGDPVLNFKDLTRDLEEMGGPAARLLAGARAAYAYRGQKRLWVLAALSFALSWGAGWLAANRQSWLDPLTASSAQGAQASAYLQSHIDWLGLAGQGFQGLGLLFGALALWRAFHFMQPLYHGAQLLDADIAEKRGEIEQMLAHQARNVDLLGTETNKAAKNAGEAERRAAAAGAAAEPPIFLENDGAAQARAAARGFFVALSERIMANAKPGVASSKVIVAIDGFEALPQAEAIALLGKIQPLLARSGFVTIFALDAAGLGLAPQELARRIQLPLRLGDAAPAQGFGFAPLDAPFDPVETRLLEALAPLAGGTPRARKQLANSYRFIRAQAEGSPGLFGLIALFLAAELGGEEADIKALQQALKVRPEFILSNVTDTSPRLRDATAALREIIGPTQTATAQQAALLARQIAL